jgi:PAS domain S-box-containing protein
MRDEDKTREQLLAELHDLRGRVAAFERNSAESKPFGLLHQEENAGRFRQLYEEAPLPYQSLDENGNFLDVNQAWLDSLGYTKEDAIGRNFADFLHPDQVEHFQRNFPRFKATGQVIGVEFEMVKKDGSTLTVSFNGRIGRTPQGAFRQTHCIFQDITERKRAEEALRDSEERYHQLFDNIKDAVFVHLPIRDGIPGRFIEVNGVACERLGYAREELLQMSPGDIDAPDTLAAIPRVIEELRRHGHATWEGAHITRDGRRIPVEISIRVFDLRGFQVILSTARDITERKKAEEEQALLQARLNQAPKMESVGRLAGGVAHDFNNMLSVILGHAEMAREEIDRSHALFADLTEIIKAAERSADLTKQLLAFARRQTISPRTLDLNETVEGMLKMLRRLIGEDIDLAWLPSGTIWPVKVDPGQVDQILANLCVNARDAISGVGKVTIETGTAVFDREYCARHPGFGPGEFVLLAVSDNGCGMDKEALGKIFEPFYTTKGVGEGTGLGLATVYGIIRQNNGFINVYSEPGQGTTFKLYIPRAVEQKKEKHPVFLKRSLRGKETVLLVEDEEAILAMGKSILKRHGYEVLAAKTPREALAMVQNYPAPIHLLITDVVMPEMNGKDLGDILARQKPDIKTIFMSGYTANVIAHRGILDEGIDFLQKPFSIQTLLAKVRDVLEK